MKLDRRAKLFLLVLLTVLSSLMPVTASAQTSAAGVTVTMDMDSASIVAGDWITFHTLIRNTGDSATPPLVASLNVASIRPGPHVDPEDWSPLRYQYIEAIAPGESVELEWEIHTLFEGDFAVYVTLLSQDKDFVPAGSSTLHIHAEPDNVLPLDEVLPVAAIVPLIPLALLVLTSQREKRRGKRRSISKQ